MNTKIKVVMNTTVYGHTVGEEVTLDADSKGTPLLKVWRKRLQDKGEPCTLLMSEEPKRRKTKKELTDGE